MDMVMMTSMAFIVFLHLHAQRKLENSIAKGEG